MPLKLQFKLIISSLIVLLLAPMLLYFFADNEVGQFLISFSSYFGAVISILGIYLLMMSYIKHRETLAHEENKKLQRGYFQIEKIKTSLTSINLTTQKAIKLLVTDNFKQYETEEPMHFYSVNLITKAKLILNLEISIEYTDLSFTDRLYVARVEENTQIIIPQRLSQTVENKLKQVDLKAITLAYDTLAGEKMRLVFEEGYQKMSCYGEDALNKEVKLYTEYLNEMELRSLN